MENFLEIAFKIDKAALLFFGAILIVGLINRHEFMFNLTFVSIEQREKTIKIGIIGLPIAAFVWLILKTIVYFRG